MPESPDTFQCHHPTRLDFGTEHAVKKALNRTETMVSNVALLPAVAALLNSDHT